MAYPPLQSRIRERDVNGLPQVEVLCGTKNCGTVVAEMTCGWSPRAHKGARLVRFSSGFQVGTDGVVDLTHRAAQQWARAKREGTSWTNFLPKSRRVQVIHDEEVEKDVDEAGNIIFVGRRQGPIHEWALPSGAVTPDAATFRCPVCDRLNLVAVPSLGSGEACCAKHAALDELPF